MLYVYYIPMYIIEVIPLTILPSNAPQLLSYFFNKNLEKGAIVEISIGNRKVIAAVVASNPLEEQKITLRKSGFQLKKLSRVISEIPQISNAQFQIALWLSRYYYAPLGYCLKTVLPPFFLKKSYETTRLTEKKLEQQTVFQKPLFILSNAKEALISIFPFIKKAIEKQGQVILIIPDASTIEYFYETLAITYNVVKINSGLSNKDIYKAWQKISSGEADIVLGTRQSLFMPFKNLELVIVDDVLNEAYKSDMTPKYNTADLAKAIADFNGAKIIYISPISGIDNYYQLKNREYELLDKTKHRASVKTVNMVEEIKKGNFSIFSQEFKKQLLSILNPSNQKKKILLFSPRRGYSGVLVCQNCGYAVKCKDCGVAFRVHKTTDLILVCPHCSRSIKMPDNCPSCNSFRLKTVGPVGTQKIYDEIQRLISMNNLDKVPVLILDSDVIKNETEEEEIVQEMKNSKTSIIIATQMIFSHRYDIKFDLIGVMNTDSLINTPDLRTEERLFYQMEKLLDFQPKNMFLQTYNPENKAISAVEHGNYQKFYEEELEIRKVFSYPPYSRLVKLTFKHKNRDKASYEAMILSERLKMAIAQMNPVRGKTPLGGSSADHAVEAGRTSNGMKLGQKIKLIDSHPAFIEKERGLFVYNIILKILPELDDIREILKFAPLNWSIDVDPRSII